MTAKQTLVCPLLNIVIIMCKWYKMVSACSFAFIKPHMHNMILYLPTSKAKMTAHPLLLGDLSAPSQTQRSKLNSTIFSTTRTHVICATYLPNKQHALSWNYWRMKAIKVVTVEYIKIITTTQLICATTKTPFDLETLAAAWSKFMDNCLLIIEFPFHRRAISRLEQWGVGKNKYISQSG